MYFHPKVVYWNPEEKREHSIIRYAGNRVLNSNKNLLIALTGQTGAGKSWCGVSIAEMYAKAHGIPFDPEIHIIFSLKQLLQLITRRDIDKMIRNGSVLVFDEPQIEANARDWQSEANRILNQLISTFRNQRLVVFFATPFLEFIDKQSRILFHAEFKVLGYDKGSGITRVKPRFLEYSKKADDFYRKRLIIEYAVHDKEVHNIQKLDVWHVPKPSPESIEVYERKKKQFTDELNLKLLKNLEMKDKIEVARDKSQDLVRVQQLMNTYGEDYLTIAQEMPHISPLSLEKLIQLVKRTAKKKGIGNASA